MGNRSITKFRWGRFWQVLTGRRERMLLDALRRRIIRVADKYEECLLRTLDDPRATIRERSEANDELFRLHVLRRSQRI